MNLVTWSRSSDAFTTGDPVNFLQVKNSSKITTGSGDAISRPAIMFSSPDNLSRGQYLLYESNYYEIFEVIKNGYYGRVTALEIPDKL
jgi:hypothetical protein